MKKRRRMSNMSTRHQLIAVFFTMYFLSCFVSMLDAAVGFTSNKTVCENVLTKWLTNVDYHVIPENATLTVDWSSLDNRLHGNGCKYDNLFLELWRVVKPPVSRRPDNFGTEGYFNTYERCNKLEPDSFRYHATEAKLSSKLANATNKAVFTHVVEDEYVLRLCPCGRRRHQRVCDCEYDIGQAKTHCSEVFRIKKSPKAKVLKWCMPEYTKSDEANYYADDPSSSTSATTTTTGPDDSHGAEIVVRSTLINCTHALVGGTIPSCTPIQSYDKVELSFHKSVNKTAKNCSQIHDFGTPKAVKVVARLDPNSTYDTNGKMTEEIGTGEFSVIVGLSNDSNYCLQIEFVDHPYCSRRLIIRDTQKLPKICSVHVTNAIPTGKCIKHIRPRTSHKDNFPFWLEKLFLGLFLGTLLVTIIVLVVCIRSWVSKHLNKKFPNDREHEHILIDSPIIKPGPWRPKRPRSSNALSVFFLHFSSNNGEEDLRCRLMREWLQSIAHTVYDLNDDTFDESINADPERWIIKILQERDVKVILASSVAAACVIRPTVTRGHSCTTSSTGVSSTGSLASNSTVSSRKSFNPKEEAAEDKAVTDYHKEQETEAELKVGLLHQQDSVSSDEFDPRRELRVFALKQVQSHFTGNYRQLAIVSFDSHRRVIDRGQGDEEQLLPVDDVVSSSLTPNKGPLVLPYHFSDLKDWMGLQSSNADSSNGGIRRNSKRHSSSLRNCQNSRSSCNGQVTDHNELPLSHLVAAPSSSSATAAALPCVENSVAAEQRLRDALISSI